MCMGDIGTPSRILAARFGAPFTYATFHIERTMAPGQLAFGAMRDVYRYEQIGPDTEVYGVIADPVAHSLSPLVHNTVFRKLGVNALYLPFRVPRGDFAETVTAFEQLPVSGYSVTIPHKEAAAALAVTSDDRVRETGAANTLVKRADGFHAFNTDYEAALEGLRRNMPVVEGRRREIKEASAMVLGTGGAARAVAHALHRAGAGPIWVVGRTADKTEKLAAEVHGKAVEWAARHNLDPGIVVNCTPIGMHPNMDETPVHAGFLKPGMVVFDTVYNPEQTLLIKEARARGCQTVTGVEMFVRQAAMQFELFTGQPADVEAMREVLRKALSPVTYREDEAEEQ
jgi:3-dehydroquinate dehydratase/shikimate dehydrogenase